LLLLLLLLLLLRLALRRFSQPAPFQQPPASAHPKQ